MTETIAVKVAQMTKNIVTKPNEEPQTKYKATLKSVAPLEKTTVNVTREDVPFEFEEGQILTVTIDKQ